MPKHGLKVSLPAPELTLNLTQFRGTEHYYRTHPSLLATDGVKYLADEAGAYWLFDLLWGVLPKIMDEFAVLKLSLREGTNGAVLKIHDGREPEKPSTISLRLKR